MPMQGTPGALNTYSYRPPPKKGPYYGMTPGEIAGMAVDLVAGTASAPAELGGSVIAGGMKALAKGVPKTTIGRSVGESVAGGVRSVSVGVAPKATISAEKGLAKRVFGRQKYRPPPAEQAEINDAAKWGDSMMDGQPPDHLPYNLERHNGLHVKDYEHVQVYGSKGLEPTGLPADSEHVYIHFTPASTGALQKEAIATQHTGLHYAGKLGPAGREADAAMDEVMKVYPNSKLHLGGYSMGGATTERQMARFANNPNIVEGVTIHGNTSGVNRLATATEARINGTTDAMETKLTHLKFESDAISSAGHAHGKQYAFSHPEGALGTKAIHGKTFGEISDDIAGTGWLRYKGNTPLVEAGGRVGETIDRSGLRAIKDVIELDEDLERMSGGSGSGSGSGGSGGVDALCAGPWKNQRVCDGYSKEQSMVATGSMSGSGPATIDETVNAVPPAVTTTATAATPVVQVASLVDEKENNVVGGGLDDVEGGANTVQDEREDVGDFDGVQGNGGKRGQPEILGYIYYPEALEYYYLNQGVQW